MSSKKDISIDITQLYRSLEGKINMAEDVLKEMKNTFAQLKTKLESVNICEHIWTVDRSDCSPCGVRRMVCEKCDKYR
jgi:uncharacterized protein YegJ (DUF2314 family)